MKRESKTKFYTFSQNNSGGIFIVNDAVARHVIIEAQDADEANYKMSRITDGNDWWCSCCGERWGIVCDRDGTEVPMIYGTQAENYTDRYFTSATIVYYYNGEIKRLRYDQKETKNG